MQNRLAISLKKTGYRSIRTRSDDFCMSSEPVSGAVGEESDSAQAFARQGYAVIRSFMSPSEVEECLQNVGRYIAEVVPNLSPEEVFYEDRENPATLKQLQSMHLNDEWFENFFRGRVHQCAREFLGGEVVGKNMQFFNKPPGASRPTPAHQDGFYFKLDPPLALTMWLALDPADEENGCVRYVEGSHLKGMRSHTLTNTLGFSQGISDFGSEDDKANEVALAAASGDLLVHDSMTIHRAEGNRAVGRQRRALGFIFYSVEAKEDSGAREKYRRQLSGQQKGRI